MLITSVQITRENHLFSLRFLIFDKIFPLFTGKTAAWNIDERFLECILNLPEILG
jgi:hypothetical protein